jgi:Flp pilus assembly protein TadD
LRSALLLPGLTGILSLHLADAGRYEEAIKAARTGTTLEPGYFLAHHLLGEASGAAGRIDDAVASFERAVDVAPRSVLPTSWLAVLYRLRGAWTRNLLRRPQLLMQLSRQ